MRSAGGPFGEAAPEGAVAADAFAEGDTADATDDACVLAVAIGAAVIPGAGASFVREHADVYNAAAAALTRSAAQLKRTRLEGKMRAIGKVTRINRL